MNEDVDVTRGRLLDLIDLELGEVMAETYDIHLTDEQVEVLRNTFLSVARAHGYDLVKFGYIG